MTPKYPAESSLHKRLLDLRPSYARIAMSSFLIVCLIISLLPSNALATDKTSETNLGEMNVYVVRPDTGSMTISFVSGGGEGQMDDAIVPCDEDYALPKCEFTYEGHNFLFWEDIAGKQYTTRDTIPANTFKPGDKIRLTAIWTELLDSPSQSPYTTDSGAVTSPTITKTATKLLQTGGAGIICVVLGIVATSFVIITVVRRRKREA